MTATAPSLPICLVYLVIISESHGRGKAVDGVPLDAGLDCFVCYHIVIVTVPCWSTEGEERGRCGGGLSLPLDNGPARRYIIDCVWCTPLRRAGEACMCATDHDVVWRRLCNTVFDSLSLSVRGSLIVNE